ncbi:MAG TPA: zinc ABC transporter substrate-binding protein [Rhizobacter sp.]|nr:zinc ABC transporter substrate-binding protein [Rhizobacter sp.]
MDLAKRRSMLALAALPTRTLSQTARPLRVVASFSILADLLRNIGGDAVEIVTLVGPNADAHVFEPSPADAKHLADAEIVVVNGLGFEGWLDRLVRASGYRGPVVVASAGVAARTLGAAPDPHAWQDLSLARRYVLNLRDALAQARPAQAGAFEQRAAQYTEQLTALDAQVRKAFDAIPKPQRRVITSHDAFGYFGAAYGIEFLAPQGMSTDSEASAAAVAHLIEQIRRQGVHAVFVENITDPRLVERIAREGGAVLGGRLYSDALSLPGTEADTYLKLFAHNAAALAAGMRAR